MTLSIDERDIQEIEENMDALTQWLLSHYTGIGAAGLILQAIFDKLDEVKTKRKEKENNLYAKI